MKASRNELKTDTKTHNNDQYECNFHTNPTNQTTSNLARGAHEWYGFEVKWSRGGLPTPAVARDITLGC